MPLVYHSVCSLVKVTHHKEGYRLDENSNCRSRQKLHGSLPAKSSTKRRLGDIKSGSQGMVWEGIARAVYVKKKHCDGLIYTKRVID